MSTPRSRARSKRGCSAAMMRGSHHRLKQVGSKDPHPQVDPYSYVNLRVPGTLGARHRTVNDGPGVSSSLRSRTPFAPTLRSPIGPPRHVNSSGNTAADVSSDEFMCPERGQPEPSGRRPAPTRRQSRLSAGAPAAPRSPRGQASRHLPRHPSSPPRRPVSRAPRGARARPTTTARTPPAAAAR